MTQLEAAPTSTPRPRTRTCVGCGEQVQGEPGDLVRLVLGPDSSIAVDARGGGFGRGAYVHARRPCLERAVKGGLARSAKGKIEQIALQDAPAPVPLRIDTLARAIQSAMDRRIEGLLAAAVRSRQLARGADAVTGACQRGEAELVVVACDAAAAAELGEVRRAVAEGRAVAWATKEQLGHIVAPQRGRTMLSGDSPGARPEPQGAGVAVVAVTSGRIAEALRGSARVAAACAEIACAPASEGGQRRPGRKRQDAAPRGAATRSSD